MTTGHIIRTAADSLRVAVEMEKRGEAFYRRAVPLCGDAAVAELLGSLASEERAHRAVFEAMLAECAHPQSYGMEEAAWLSAVAADIIFPGGLTALRREGFDSAAGVLRAAVASEKDSVLFYGEIVRNASEGFPEVHTINEIIRQERRHLMLLEARLEAAAKA